MLTVPQAFVCWSYVCTCSHHNELDVAAIKWITIVLVLLHILCA